MPSESTGGDRGIARQYLHTFAFALARIISHALLIVILGRAMTLEEYGAYALIATAIPVGVTVVGLDLYAYVAREIPGLPRDRGVAVFKGAFRFQVLSSLLLVSLVLATGLDGAVIKHTELARYRTIVRMGLLVFPFAYLQRELARYFIAVKRIEVSNVSQFLCTNSWAYAILLLLLAHRRLTLPIIFTAWIAGGAVSVLYSMWEVQRLGFFRQPAARGVVTKGLRFSLPLLAGAVGFQVNDVSGRYVISHFRPLAEAGGFSFLQTLVTTGGVLTYTIIEAILRPRIVEADNLKNPLRRSVLLNRLLRYSWVLLLPVMTVLLISGPELLALISQPGYARYLSLVPYFATTALVMASAVPFSIVLFLQRRTGLMGGINLTGAAANVGLSILLVPSIGAAGACLAGLLAFTGVLIANYCYARHAGCTVSLRDTRLFPLVISGLVMAAAMLGARALWTGAGAPGGPALGLLLVSAVGTAAFGAAAWLSGVVEPAEKAYARRLMARLAGRLPAGLAPAAPGRTEQDVSGDTGREP